MDVQKIREYSLTKLKSIPLSFTGYFKSSFSAVEKAKKERNYFLAVFWFAVFVLSAFVLMLGFLYSAEKDFTVQYTKANLFKHVMLFDPGAAFVLGLITAAVFAFTYIFIRFCCVKLFMRKTKAKTVLADSVIEFGLNSILFSLFFLLGGALCLISGFLYFPVLLIFSLLFNIILLSGIIGAVPKERRSAVFYIITALFSLLGFLFVAAAFAVLLLYIAASLISGTAERINEIKSNLHSFLDYLTDKFFAVINRF